ncbi:uncharacterized protein UV8b_04911 [Ustilaginoidea virens]|uniref:Uncharacterized protein n=1 Tax=Ustilaginoidea virens TaxID=1159556 RepID=A0A8E5HSQ5_USTVR|nr:uncharacterized protein UV8b_04911 [Ustilaginoidea virens]QUC20670.1 hypothetical protein UV8b_04911 [Ustilaginoidea virens]
MLGMLGIQGQKATRMQHVQDTAVAQDIKLRALPRDGEEVGEGAPPYKAENYKQDTSSRQSMCSSGKYCFRSKCTASDMLCFLSWPQFPASVGGANTTRHDSASQSASLAVARLEGERNRDAERSEN